MRPGSSIVEASADELGVLLDRCQKWEAEDDPSAAQLPRAKRHDDKSLAAVNVR